MLKRDGGKLCFATLRDGSGDLQVMLSLAEVGEEQLDLWKRIIDLGDHVSVTGEVITSRKGELSVSATSWVLTAKSLRPLPEKHKGLTDPEARARMRYVDLIVRPEARSAAYMRATMVHSVRDSLHRRGFVEVETPILQQIHGGANARPFETHINAYNLDVFLRIATELHLKRLLVGGMERVFELGRQFRNEGADSSHNPEFTSLEMYQTYSDYQDMRILTQEMIQEAAIAALRRAGGPSDPARRLDQGVRPVRGVAAHHGRRCSQREARRAHPRRHPDRGDAGARGHAPHRGRGALDLGCGPRGPVRGAVRGLHGASDVLHGLPQGDRPADQGPPRRPAVRREVGPRVLGSRAGHRLLRAQRPRRPARAVLRPVAAGRGRRPGGHGDRRRLPAPPWTTACRPPVAREWASTAW